MTNIEPIRRSHRVKDGDTTARRRAKRATIARKRERARKYS